MIWIIILYLTIGYVFANEHIARIKRDGIIVDVFSFLLPLFFWLPTLIYVPFYERKNP